MHIVLHFKRRQPAPNTKDTVIRTDNILCVLVHASPYLQSQEMSCRKFFFRVFLAHKFRMLKCKRMICNSSFTASGVWPGLELCPCGLLVTPHSRYIAGSRKFLLFLDPTGLSVNNVMLHERTHVLTSTMEISKDSNYTQNRLHCRV